jgi:hypothetical protein
MDEQVLVIRGSEWCRGSGGYSYLRTGTGTYCCLGLHGRMHGVADWALQGRTSPRDAAANGAVLPDAYASAWTHGDSDRSENTESAGLAMRVNDAPEIDDDERIATLRPIFAAIGVTLDWRPNE